MSLTIILSIQVLKKIFSNDEYGNNPLCIQDTLHLNQILFAIISLAHIK